MCFTATAADHVCTALPRPLLPSPNLSTLAQLPLHHHHHHHPSHLTGKTKDSNSNFLAKTLFDLAIDLKRIEVIADDEDEITEAVRRLSSNYDLVITSGESAEPLRVAELMLFDFRRNRTNT